MDALPISSTKPTVLKRLLTKVRACFSYRLPVADSHIQSPSADSPLRKPKSFPVLTPHQHAFNMMNLAGQKIRAGEGREAGPMLVESAFFFEQFEPRSPVVACRLLGKAGRVYLQDGDSERARLHYQAASDLAGMWGLFPLARHYQNLAGEIPSS